MTTVSANPSDQRQWTQEVRYAADVTPTVGLCRRRLRLPADDRFDGKQEQGSAAARFLLAPTALAATPGLLDGYGQTSDIRSTNVSAALFGQLEWSLTDRLRLLPGLRFNYDQKAVDYDTQIYGGLQTTDPALIALQRSILAPQAYQADVDDTNVSGQVTAAYQIVRRVHAFATYATSFKSVGLNLAGVPTNAAGQPALEAATVKPEDERHIEVGLKTEPLPGVTANFTAFNTDIQDYQAQVVNASVGVLRGYLANADKVRVRGVEFDGSARVHRNLSFYGAAAYTDGKYVSFPDAPPPLEETGGPQVKDISGSDLPGISKWALSLGGEYVNRGEHPRPGRASFSVRSMPAIGPRSRRTRAPRAIWSSRAMPCSTPASASDGRTDGPSPSGPATCWTRTTSSCCPRRLAARPLRGTTRRAENRRRDRADVPSIAQLIKRAHSAHFLSRTTSRRCNIRIDRAARASFGATMRSGPW